MSVRYWLFLGLWLQNVNQAQACKYQADNPVDREEGDMNMLPFPSPDQRVFDDQEDGNDRDCDCKVAAQDVAVPGQPG